MTSVTRIQTGAMAPMTGDGQHRTRRGLARRRVVRIGASLALALLLLLVPSRTHSAFAACGLDGTDTATGTGALASECGGVFNTADGVTALTSNTTGGFNTAAGTGALHDNTTGSSNTAAGAAALQNNTTGGDNTAAGFFALISNTTGYSNTAAGSDALSLNTTGYGNTASGRVALQNNTSGYDNTAVGGGALYSNTTGFDNIAVGSGAGATATSANANTTGSDNTFLGFQSGPGTPTQLSHATAIGANALVSESDALVLGAPGTKVGIGTSSPHSTLQVVGGYIQLPTISGAAPPAADCAGPADYGRMIVRTDGAITLYVCTVRGWRFGL
jgi:hypothetical protein